MQRFEAFHIHCYYYMDYEEVLYINVCLNQYDQCFISSCFLGSVFLYSGLMCVEVSSAAPAGLWHLEPDAA